MTGMEGPLVPFPYGASFVGRHRTTHYSSFTPQVDCEAKVWQKTGGTPRGRRLTWGETLLPVDAHAKNVLCKLAGTLNQERQAHELRHAADVQLPHQAAAMLLDRLDAQIELAGDDLVGVAFHD